MWPPTQKIKITISKFWFHIIFKWVIFVTHMHNSPRFSSDRTKYVIFMIHWKFRDRCRINMSHKGRQKRTQFIRVFWVIHYESSITKFSVNHKYDVLSSMRRKSGWIMHLSHKYDSFKDAMKSEFTDSIFLFFA